MSLQWRQLERYKGKFYIDGIENESIHDHEPQSHYRYVNVLPYSGSILNSRVKESQVRLDAWNMDPSNQKKADL